MEVSVQATLLSVDADLGKHDDEVSITVKTSPYKIFNNMRCMTLLYSSVSVASGRARTKCLEVALLTNTWSVRNTT